MWEITLQKHPFVDRWGDMTIAQLKEIRKELLPMDEIDKTFKFLIHGMLI